MDNIAHSASVVAPLPAPKVQSSSKSKRKLRLVRVIPVPPEVSAQNLNVVDESRVLMSIMMIAYQRKHPLALYLLHGKDFTKKFKPAKPRPKAHPVQTLETKFKNAKTKNLNHIGEI